MTRVHAHQHLPPRPADPPHYKIVHRRELHLHDTRKRIALLLWQASRNHPRQSLRSATSSSTPPSIKSTTRRPRKTSSRHSVPNQTSRFAAKERTSEDGNEANKTGLSTRHKNSRKDTLASIHKATTQRHAPPKKKKRKQYK